jgi:hypothetical protein
MGQVSEGTVLLAIRRSLNNPWSAEKWQKMNLRLKGDARHIRK